MGSSLNRLYDQERWKKTAKITEFSFFFPSLYVAISMIYVQSG